LDFDEFWNGDVLGAEDDSAFRTAYPEQAEFPDVISYTQGITARALYEWAHSSYNTTGIDYTPWCKSALNYAVALTAGKWGGFYYHPTSHGGTLHSAGSEEFFAYTALMALGMHVVDASAYASQIARSKAWMDALTETDGRVWNEQHANELTSNGETIELKFLAINTAYMLLVKAHEV
jgi:hypothetical protein